jgi:CheY-like chemotaxis protein
MVITMPRQAGMDMFDLGRRIKVQAPRLPVIMLTQRHMQKMDESIQIEQSGCVDQTFIWSGNTDILVALIKCVEDRLNVEHDTECAGIRVVLMIEDSPLYLSSILPMMYKVMVTQTQNLIGEGLNEEHRLLTMRARPKILIADNYEDARAIYTRYKKYILGVISDVRFPRDGRLDDDAGLDLLQYIKQDRWDIPLLLMSSDPANAAKAKMLSSQFIDKNSPTLQAGVRSFVLNKLGFGDFCFRSPSGNCIGRATNLRSMEQLVPGIPDESFLMHWNNNDFSRWLFARTETVLGSLFRPATAEDFHHDIAKMKQYLIENIQKMRRQRQKAVVINFDAVDFDFDAPFFKIGNGSLGGKARGLAFMSVLLQLNAHLAKKYAAVDIFVPQSLVITTEGFDHFIETNELGDFANADTRDDDVNKAFTRAQLPDWIKAQLRAYLTKIRYPLAVRSSSLLEDDQFKPYAGLYRTYMVPNDHPDLEVRLTQLSAAIKLVYASTYYQDPKKFALRVGHRTEEEKMAIIIQQVVGQPYNGFYYPTLSGVAQSHNYYPFSKMKSEEGVITIGMGLGRLVMEGEAALRFSPAHPHILPQFSKVEDILDNAQKTFYALKLAPNDTHLCMDEDTAVTRCDISDMVDAPSMQLLASTYDPDEHRIRDTYHHPGMKVLTFAPILKHDVFPLPKLMQEIMNIGQVGMGCPVELEFSLNLFSDRHQAPELAILQLRPMTEVANKMSNVIDDGQISKSFCHSNRSLGNSDHNDIHDIIYVRPDTFDPSRTTEIAFEIGRFNSVLTDQRRKYLLVGPGRWGSADKWLGIPVRWADISGVAAIIETYSDKLEAEPSQGSHFFHNIISLGINYITIQKNSEDFFHWDMITSQPRIKETEFVIHARTRDPMCLKVDGANSKSVIWTV